MSLLNISLDSIIKSLEIHAVRMNFTCNEIVLDFGVQTLDSMKCEYIQMTLCAMHELVSS